MPTVFTLSGRFHPTINTFPSFHGPGEALRVCREVALSLSDWSNGFLRGKGKYHLSVNLLGISEENISLLGEMMEAMATCLQDNCPRGSTDFQVIIYKAIQVSSPPSQYSNIHHCLSQKPWRFPEFVKPLGLSEDVKTLKIYYSDIDSFDKWEQMATDLEFCMVKKLGRAWPSLQEIIFFCNRTPDVLMMKRESNWTVIECTSELEPLDEVLAGVAEAMATGQLIPLG